MEPPGAELAEPHTVRLICAAYVSEPAIAPLADDVDEPKVFETVEQLTFVRGDAEMPLPSGVRRSALLTDAHGYGWIYINAAFCYTLPTGSRFNGPGRGAWYATCSKIAIAKARTEVVFHLTRGLRNVGIYENVTNYRELLAGLIGPFVGPVGPIGSTLSRHGYGGRIDQRCRHQEPGRS